MKKFYIILLIFLVSNSLKGQTKVPCKVVSTTTHDSISKRDSFYTVRRITKRDSVCGWKCGFWCQVGVEKPKWVCKYTWDTTYKVFSKKVDTIFRITHDTMVDGMCTSVAANCEYGVIVNGFTDNSLRATIAQNLGADWFRDGITVSDFELRGAPGHVKFKSFGFKTATNISWVDQLSGIRPFVQPKDTAKYASVLHKIFTKHPDIDIAVCENEEDNWRYYNSPIDDYIKNLEIFTRVAHQHGVKVSNGGIFTQMLTYLVWEWYKNTGRIAEANWWWWNAMNEGQRWYAKTGGNADYAKHIANHRKLIAAYKRIPLDYVNFHLYEPLNDIGDGKHLTAECLKRITAYLKAATGKAVINNELGQHNEDPLLVTEMLEGARESGMKLAIWYSGDDTNGDRARSLVNPDGSLRDNGYAFLFFMTGIALISP